MRLLWVASIGSTFLLGGAACGAASKPSDTAPASTPLDAAAADPKADATVDAAASAPEHAESVTDGRAPERVVKGTKALTRSAAPCPHVGLFLEVAASTKTRCDVAGGCTTPIPIRIVNCTDRVLVPNTLGVHAHGAATEVPLELARKIMEAGGGVAPDARLPIESPGELSPKTRLDGLTVDLGVGQKWALELFAEDAQTKGLFTSAKASTTIVDEQVVVAVERETRARSARGAACRARGGSLEIVGGLAPSEECVFPFPDAGKLCHDKADCRGECLLVRTVPVGGGLVRVEGKCSRLEVTFGCATRIGRTPGGRGIVREDEVGPGLCVD